MGCIQTPQGIIPYYIDFKLKRNEAMRRKTFTYNKSYWLTRMSLNERINLKAHYLGGNGITQTLRGLILHIHLLNDVFFTTPFSDFKKLNK